MLDPVAAYRADTKELPLFLYESELHIVDNQPTLSFLPVQYRIAVSSPKRFFFNIDFRVETLKGLVWIMLPMFPRVEMLLAHSVNS